jgi:hypothetical protein
VNTGTAFVSHGQSPKAMQPGQGAFDDPPRPAEAAAVRPAALGELRRDATRQELIAVRLRVVASVPLYQVRAAERATRTPAQRGHGVDERQQLGDVVSIRRRQPRDERNPVRVGENMMFRPGLAAIGRVRSSFFPPRSARSEELSTTARAKSIWPRRRNSLSNTVWRRFQTPARCQRTNRRQQVVPDPHPISRGSMFHGSPLRSTKRIPVITARSGIGGRPAYCRLRGRRLGSSGSIRAHNASSMRAWGIADRLTLGQATVPSLQSQYKRSVS